MDLGHWVCMGNLAFHDGAFGFVYLVENKLNSRKYIGCKQLRFKRVRPRNKSRKKKEVHYVESDWRTYTTSSSELNRDIASQGLDTFSFWILSFHDCKRSMLLEEARLIIHHKALDDMAFYNKWLRVRISGKNKK